MWIRGPGGGWLVPGAGSVGFTGGSRYPKRVLESGGGRQVTGIGMVGLTGGSRCSLRIR